MTYSLNETESLCRKAARGTGYSWGLAEDAGRAARWLHAHDLPGASLLAELLRAQDGQPLMRNAPDRDAEPWQAASGNLCPILTGCALSDISWQIGAGRVVRLGPTRCPLMLAPFADAIAIRTGQPVLLTWQDAEITVHNAAFTLSGHNTACLSAPLIEMRLGQPQTSTPGASQTRADIPPDIFARLTAFAQRTYAPATEASRLAGAGAGLSDND